MIRYFLYSVKFLASPYIKKAGGALILPSYVF